MRTLIPTLVLSEQAEVAFIARGKSPGSRPMADKDSATTLKAFKSCVECELFNVLQSSRS